MSAAQTSAFFCLLAWPADTGATSLSGIDPVEDVSEPHGPGQRRFPARSASAVNAAASAATRPRSPEVGATLMCPAQRGPDLRVIDLAEVAAVQGAGKPDLDFLVLSSHYRYRKLVKAKVTVRRGRLNLVIPEALLEGQ